MRFWFLIAISLLFVSQSHGVEGQSLAQLFAELDDIRTDFDQTIADGYGRILETSSGTLSISKPSARWEVTNPYPQTILLNDKYLQIYDPDLEQVTERNLEAGWEEVPLALLLGTGADIEQHFTVISSTTEGTTEFTLTPKSPEALFAQVRVIVQFDHISQLSIQDHGNQETVILFRNYEPDVVLESNIFELDLPPGTDVIRG